MVLHFAGLSRRPVLIAATLLQLAVPSAAQQLPRPVQVDDRASESKGPYLEQTGLCWDALPSMRAGVKLRLVLTDGSEVVGYLVAARADAVVLERSKVRKGRFIPPAGMTLRDSLPFLRADVSSVQEAKGWPFWAKAAIWIGVAWLAAGVIAGSIVGNS